MAGRPITRARAEAITAAAREVRAWRAAEAARIDADPNLSEADRVEAHESLGAQFREKLQSSMERAKQLNTPAKLRMRQLRAEIDERHRPTS